MLGLNPEAIEYYKAIDADYINHEIIKVGDKQYITDPTKDYYDLVNKIRKLFTITSNTNYNEYIKTLTTMKKELEKATIELIKKANIKVLQDTDSLLIAKTILGNIYKEKYTEAQKRLLNTP